jgi:hypothetical protein
MISKNQLPEDLSGIAESRYITENYQTGIISVNVYASYYRSGILHREDGPAVLLDGKSHEWWVHGRQCSEEEYGHWLEKKALNEKLNATLDLRSKEKTKKI